MGGDGECFILSDVLDGLKLSKKQFQQMCIAAGCDYHRNVKGVGIHKAFQMVASEGAILELLAKRGASNEYKECFYKAEAVFQHQTVFDLVTCSTVPLEKCETKQTSDVQFLCGKYPFATCIHIKTNFKTKLQSSKLVQVQYLFLESYGVKESFKLVRLLFVGRP